MATLTHLLNRCAVRTENIENWVGSYENAKGLRVKHLSEKCFFCFGDYTLKSQVVTFSCGHAMHADCLRNLRHKVCPYDKTSLVGTKVSLLGYSILVPREPFGNYIGSRLDQINRFLQARMRSLAPSLQNGPNREALEALVQHLQKLFDTFSNVYNNPPGSNEEMVALINDFHQQLMPHLNALGQFVDFNFDLAEVLRAREDYLTSMFQDMELYPDHPKTQALAYSTTFYLAQTMLGLASQVVFHLDVRFRDYHLQAYQTLPDAASRYRYLAQMDSSSLKRLNRFLLNGFEEIHDSIRKIEKKRTFCNHSLAICLGLLFTVSMISNLFYGSLYGLK